MRPIRFPVLLLFLSGRLCFLFADSQENILRFIHREGEVLHADSLVDETVILNGRFSHNARIEELSVSTVKEVDEQGEALLDTRFRTVEQVSGFPGSLEWISEEKVAFRRDATGLMTLPDAACRPVLRNVPRFPSEAVAPGDSWTLPAEEVHVFRFSGEYYGPYRGQVRVFYRYLENVDTPLGPAARLSLEYNVYLPIHSPTEPVSLLSGQSKQEVLWDISLGRPISKSEDFEFFMMTSDGSTREFTGTTETIYRYTNFLNRQQEAEQIKKDFNDRAEVGIETVEEGILLTLSEEAGNILFLPDSAVISEDQKKLLSDLAESLSTYTDRDILITGHTADYGTPEGRESLSFQRAAAVAGELFPQGRKGPGRLYLRGAGSSEPAGRDSENRRVEILILD